jgi:hypothetical protein
MRFRPAAVLRQPQVHSAAPGPSCMERFQLVAPISQGPQPCKSHSVLSVRKVGQWSEYWPSRCAIVPILLAEINQKTSLSQRQRASDRASGADASNGLGNSTMTLHAGSSCTAAGHFSELWSSRIRRSDHPLRVSGNLVRYSIVQ